MLLSGFPCARRCPSQRVSALKPLPLAVGKRQRWWGGWGIHSAWIWDLKVWDLNIFYCNNFNNNEFSGRDKEIHIKLMSVNYHNLLKKKLKSHSYQKSAGIFMHQQSLDFKQSGVKNTPSGCQFSRHTCIVNESGQSKMVILV